MSYIGETRKTAFESFGTAVGGMLTAGSLRVVRIIKALARRRIIANLGEFDDRMLRDIGLTRSDLRDATAGPLWQDPTSVLVVRAVEKRAARRTDAGASSARPANARGADGQASRNLIGCG